MHGTKVKIIMVYILIATPDEAWRNGPQSVVYV